MAYFDGEEFPKSITLDAPSATVIPATVLESAISKNYFLLTGNDDLRPVNERCVFSIQL